MSCFVLFCFSWFCFHLLFFPWELLIVTFLLINKKIISLRQTHGVESSSQHVWSLAKFELLQTGSGSGRCLKSWSCSALSEWGWRAANGWQCCVRQGECSLQGSELQTNDFHSCSSCWRDALCMCKHEFLWEGDEGLKDPQDQPCLCSHTAALMYRVSPFLQQRSHLCVVVIWFFHSLNAWWHKDHHPSL